MNRAFDDVEIRVLIDRDDNTTVPNNSNVKVCVLKRNEFENYLFDKEIIMKAYSSVSEEQFDNLSIDIINDDIKTKLNDFKKLCGENNLSKLKLELAKAIKPDTKVYEELKEIIFSL